MKQLSGNRTSCPANSGHHALFNLAATGLLTAALLLSGCAASNRDGGDIVAGASAVSNIDTISISEKTMFDDLSDIVAQVFEPLTTTLQINRDNADPRMSYFVERLAAKGFGIQRVSADQGAHYLSYTLKGTTEADEIHLSVVVGAVVIGRNYRHVKRNVVSPSSVVLLSGTRVPVVVNDIPSRQFEIGNPDLSASQYVASLGLDNVSPVIALITPDIVSKVSQDSSSGPSLQALNSSQVEVNNLFYGNESTFASVLENYEQVDRQIIVFGNDSMVLGDTNKQLIEQFVTTKVKEHDVISLVGCSNGPTSLEIGNEGLALGRARRVTQALMAVGVARDKVLDEGCWAPTNFGTRFPSRGVVLELWRSHS